jgi:hypothetical protein
MPTPYGVNETLIGAIRRNEISVTATRRGHAAERRARAPSHAPPLVSVRAGALPCACGAHAAARPGPRRRWPPGCLHQPARVAGPLAARHLGMAGHTPRPSIPRGGAESGASPGGAHRRVLLRERAPASRAAVAGLAPSRCVTRPAAQGLARVPALVLDLVSPCSPRSRVVFRTIAFDETL